MIQIIFDNPMEGYGKEYKTITKNQRIYGQYFFMMYIELYHVLHDGHNTEKLDNILVTIRKIFPKLDNNRSASMWLEYNIFPCWNHCLRDYEDEIAIEQTYIDEFLNSEKEQNDLWLYCSTYFRTLLKEFIYNNEKLLKKYPTFLEGEFAEFLRRQPTLRHNNVAYFEIANLIMHTLKDKPSLFALAQKNIIDLSKLDNLEKGYESRPVCDFGKWVHHYEFLKKIAQNKLSLNVHFEYNIIKNKALFIPEEVEDFLYYTLFNSPEIVMMTTEELFALSQQLQIEKFEELGTDISKKIYDFLIEKKEFFQKTSVCATMEYEILSNIMSNKEALKRKLEFAYKTD